MRRMRNNTLNKTKTCIVNMNSSICVAYKSEDLQEKAQFLADQLELKCLPYKGIDTELTLIITPEYLELADLNKKSSIHVDFISGALEHRRKYGGGRGQAIAKAIGLKQGTQPPTILDATAGLGKDAFVFACLGCPVTMIERSPIVAALVDDAITRAKDNETFKIFLNQRFELVKANAINYMSLLDEQNQPEVIYLDPMYPERKKSALVKKNMQILQTLLGHDDDINDLLNAALKTAKKRVVVKRPKGAESIGTIKPTTSIESRKTRYDVYVSLG